MQTKKCLLATHPVPTQLENQALISKNALIKAAVESDFCKCNTTKALKGESTVTISGLR